MLGGSEGEVHKSPILCRYVDWSITVPLQMIDFILKTARSPVSGEVFWRLLIGTIMMLGFVFAGEIGGSNAWVGFIFGMVGWAYILYEIFFGEAGGVASECSEAVKDAGLREVVVVVGCWWCCVVGGAGGGWLPLVLGFCWLVAVVVVVRWLVCVVGVVVLAGVVVVAVPLRDTKPVFYV